mmetsp:Transcript_74153/g.86035  ORF Transcript_74153/g.86035 Transcript_74153/m.86035 type:complete len:166 (-) Transcript_74153:167-664(-)
MFKQLTRLSQVCVPKSLLKYPAATFAEEKSTVKKYAIDGHFKEGKLFLKGKYNPEAHIINPLEANLSSLAACELATLNFYAGTKNIKIKGFDVKELAGVIDTRGFAGVPGVPARFTEVNGLIEIDSDANQQQLDELHEKVQKYCPVADLYQAAGVKMNIKFVKKA